MSLFFPRKTLTPGSYGPAVRMLQIVLRAAQLNNLIEVNGEYDEPTAEGVKALQKVAGLKETGNFDGTTREALATLYGVDVYELRKMDFDGHTMVAALMDPVADSAPMDTSLEADADAHEPLVDPTADLHEPVVDLTASKGNTAVSATEPDLAEALVTKPKARLLLLMGADPVNCEDTQRALDFFQMRPGAEARLVAFGSDEADEILPVLYAKLGREELRRPLVATVVGNEARRVDVAPSNDVLQEALVSNMRIKIGVREKEEQAPVFGSSDAPASHNGERVAFT